MAPVGPHDHVANKVRLRGRRTDAHLSPPQSSVLSLSVAYLHGRPGSRSAGGRAPSRSVPALGVCLRLGLRVRFTGPRSCVLPARLYVVAIAARPVLGARRAFARLRYRLAHRLARRAALWCVLAPAVPRRCVGVTRFAPQLSRPDGPSEARPPELIDAPAMAATMPRRGLNKFFFMYIYILNCKY